MQFPKIFFVKIYSFPKIFIVENCTFPNFYKRNTQLITKPKMDSSRLK